MLELDAEGLDHEASAVLAAVADAHVVGDLVTVDEGSVQEPVARKGKRHQLVEFHLPQDALVERKPRRIDTVVDLVEADHRGRRRGKAGRVTRRVAGLAIELNDGLFRTRRQRGALAPTP